VLSLLVIGAGLLLLAVAVLRALTEAGATNAYALVAESLLTGRPDASTCYGADCALRDGKTYIVFPPFPAVLAMPLVAIFGITTKGFIAIAIVLWALSLAVWNRILKTYELDTDRRLWLLAAIGFAGPLYYVTLRGDGVWFFAQSVAFLFVSLAIHEVVAGRRLVTAGLALGCALLSRQMSIFYAPLLLVLAFDPKEPLFRITMARIGMAFRLGLPIIAALIVYLAYNYWRFGNPFDSGYNFIAFSADGSMLGERVATYGLWNKAYVLYNLFYFFVQGFHAEFAPPMKVALSGMDNGGSAVLAASPWLLLLFFAQPRRVEMIGLLLIVGFTAVLMFYHSNGFTQYNVQRYVLDWLPAALLMLAPVLTRSRLEIFRLLVAWGVMLNVATVVVLALTKAG
jgi:hypothetical protein